MRKRYGLLMDADQPEGVNGITMPITARVGVANVISPRGRNPNSVISRESDCFGYAGVSRFSG